MGLAGVLLGLGPVAESGRRIVLDVDVQSNGDDTRRTLRFTLAEQGAEPPPQNTLRCHAPA